MPFPPYCTVYANFKKAQSPSPALFAFLFSECNSHKRDVKNTVAYNTCKTLCNDDAERMIERKRKTNSLFIIYTTVL